MADSVQIDKQLFSDRLSHFYSAWKADKRSGDAYFAGAGSITVLMGKPEETNPWAKNAAVHVCTNPSTTPDDRACRTDLRTTLVLAAWLRIPCNPLPLHPRGNVRGYNGQERYDQDLAIAERCADSCVLLHSQAP